MARQRSVPLQPLRLSTGWKVAWNSWYELDPPADPHSGDWVFFSEDRLLLQHQQARILIDVSWMPHGPKGRFVVSAVDWVGSADMPEQWDRPLLQFATRSRPRAVERVERWAADGFDWSAVKRRRRGRARAPLRMTHVRNQKLYESEDG